MSLEEPTKILISEPKFFPQAAKDILAKFAELHLVEVENYSELIKLATGKYAYIFIRLKFNLNEDFFKTARARAVATPTTGLDHIDLGSARKFGIDVINIHSGDDGMSDISATAELALGLILSITRKIPWAFNDVNRGNWSRDDYKGTTLKGKTLGIVGLGRLGSKLADYGAALGMRVVYHDIDSVHSRYEKLTALETLFKTSDIVSLHIPLNEFTKGLVDSSLIFQMKPTAYLINTSRGDVVNESSVIEALKKRSIAGYATDVISGESSQEKNWIESNLIWRNRDQYNIMITPHIGGCTHESMELAETILARKVAEHFKRLKKP